MKVTLVCDNPQSWIWPHVKKLGQKLKQAKHQVRIIDSAKRIKSGDVAFFLSCEKIIPDSLLKLNKHNLVVHESALPKGRGWSPLTWQILEGKKKIPITLFEAAASVDSGDIFFQDFMEFKGHELVDELRQIQGEKTIKLALKFIKQLPDIKAKKQKGQSTFYPRRQASDSALDPKRSLQELFNQLRVADNERYPAFFYYRGRKYILKIYKEENK